MASDTWSPISVPGPTQQRASAEPDLDSEDDHHGHKRPRSAGMPLSHAGRAFGIIGDMWRDPLAVINAGVKQNSHTPMSALSYRERKYLELFNILIKFYPNLHDELKSRGEMGPMEIVQEINKGRNAARGVDVHSIKDALVGWRTWNPALPRLSQKSLRGFHHEELGELLCPSIYNWSDPAVKKGLRQGHPKYKVGPENYPLLLWENQRCDPDDYEKGFLRNSLLVMTLRHLLFGKTAALASLDFEDGTGPKGQGTKPKAKKYGIHRVTTGAIGYAAVLLHFACASQPTMSYGGPGNFAYGKFYQSVVKYMDKTMSDEQRDELLTWYTLRVFGANDGYSSDETDSSDVENVSVAAQMRAQKKRKTDASVGGVLHDNNA